MAFETDWRADANCLSVDPNTMQPEAASADELGAALRVCDGCPVLGRCKSLALSQPDPYGIHAGEWFGDPPKCTDQVCQWCGEPVVAERSSRAYCGDTCSKRARRARAMSAELSA